METVLHIYGRKCGRLAHSNGVGIDPEVFAKASRGDPFSRGYIEGWEEAEDGRPEKADSNRDRQARQSAATRRPS